MAPKKGGRSSGKSPAKKKPARSATRKAALERPRMEAVSEAAFQGPLPCVSNFYSAFQQMSLPEEFGNQLRALGLDVRGRVTAGLFPSGFVRRDPDTLESVVVPDAGWGRGATIRVGFLDRNPDMEDRVREHVKEWEAAADVKFSFVTSAAQVRVTFRQPGFSSLLGREAEQANPAQHTMILGFRGFEPPTEVRRLILHEFGHVLGFMHEHQNPIGGVQWDFPRAIEYYRQGLPPGMPDSEIRRQLEVLPNSSKFKFSTFDPLSVMLYAIPERIVLPGTWRPEMGRNNSELSPLDRRAVVELYGPTDDGDEVRRLTVDGDALTASIGRDSEVDRYIFTAPTDRRYQIETDGEAIVHVALADEDGKPVPGDFGADSISPLRGVRMPRLLDAGDHMLLVTASEFSPQTRGGYTIRVVSAD